MPTLLDGFVPYVEADAEKYNRRRWWPGLTLGDLLDKAADVYPDKEAFVDSTTRLTFAQTREKADRLAIGLMDMGIQPMDRVLLQLPNWNEFVYTYFALQKIGAVVVLLIDRYRQYEVNHLAKLTGATAWVVPEKYKKTEYVSVIHDVLKENPRLQHVVLARGEEHEGWANMATLIDGAALTEENMTRLAERRPDPMQPAHMGPTGGTTGLPKVVPRTHNSHICSSEYATRAWDYGTDDICLLAGPMGHDLTFTKGFIGGLFTCAKLIILDSIDMGDVCRTVEREKVTAIVWVPTLASRMLHYEKLDDFDLGSLKKMHCGGGASLPDLIKVFKEKIGGTFYNAYGGTEGQTSITRGNDPIETAFYTVGKPTCPYDTYKAVGPDGNALPPNTSGELLIKGPGVFTGYYKSPEENEKVFDGDGFFRTGDVAKIDERGYITLTGRVKEMINRGGESISATEIEKLIIDHPDVVNVAVVPMPDPEMGERVCAYIQPKPGAELTFDHVISFLRGQKASVLQLPERIEFMEDLPYTKAEKIDKNALKADIGEKVETGN
ncbi:AMP-binding protein [Thermodesulfobacteriota bacterium]